VEASSSVAGKIVELKVKVGDKLSEGSVVAMSRAEGRRRARSREGRRGRKRLRRAPRRRAPRPRTPRGLAVPGSTVAGTAAAPRPAARPTSNARSS
jgi:dihydrolipoamide dehydrogenase